MSVAGYFECVLLQSTFDASTGNTYFTEAALVVSDALGFGFALADVAALGLAGADAGGAALVAADSALDDCAAGSTNFGVAAGEDDPPAPPQPARQTAAIVRPERVRSERTAPSWQKTGDRADLPMARLAGQVRRGGAR
jgi:hypothetical protein